MAIAFRCLSLLLITCSLLQGEESTRIFDVTSPETVDLDQDRLSKIDDYLQAEVKAGRIAGCLALVARGDQVAFLGTWGDRNREKSLKMNADTIFRIYSMSKPITSVAAMQLVEAGKMKLDDPVSKYLLPFKELKVLSKTDGELQEIPLAQPMTVRDLLRHTSGLTYGFFGNTEVDKAYRKAGLLITEGTIAESVEKLSSIPLLHQPGKRWHYSVSTDVLGRLIEVVSGQRFDQYLQENIFKPLEMRDTAFMVPRDKWDRFATLYQPDAQQGLKPASLIHSFRLLNPYNQFFSGGGGLCSTTYDYLRFCRALLNGGELDGKRILTSESLAEMTKNQLSGGGFQFGLGFAISPEGELSWGGAAGTRFWINPKRKLIVIYMIQINPYTVIDYGNRVKQMVYAADRAGTSSVEAATAPMP